VVNGNYISRVTVVGKVAQLELLTSRSGSTYSKLTLSVRQQRRRPNGIYHEVGSRFPIVAFSQISDTLQNTVGMGDMLAVNCRLDSSANGQFINLSLIATELNYLPEAESPLAQQAGSVSQSGEAESPF
jgi:hypothetical protein